jgi:hypothetical protein
MALTKVHRTIRERLRQRPLYFNGKGSTKVVCVRCKPRPSTSGHKLVSLRVAFNYLDFHTCSICGWDVTRDGWDVNKTKRDQS